MTGGRIRRMGSDDVEAVAELVRASFEPDLQPLLTYCQAGMGNYLRVLVEWPKAYPAHHFYVAVSADDNVIGFAEFRSMTSTCLLSYICVAPSARGNGLATRLMAHHLERFPSTAVVELDVFSHNTLALRLYERLQFERVAATVWWVRDLPKSNGEGEGELVLTDWHVSRAALQSYGFCQVAAQYRGGPVRCGLTSRTVVRVDGRELFLDDQFLGDLRAELPELRQALMICPTDVEPPTHGREVLRSYRLSATADDVTAGAR